MRVDGKSSRFQERTRTDLPIQVHCRDYEGLEWDANGRIFEITRFGAGFRLSRPVEPKRLVFLRFGMPRSLRVFDLSAEHYRVWAVIRFVRVLPPAEPGQIQLMFGSAFIGASPPASYVREPKTLYDLKPTLAQNGLWSPREIPRRSGRYARSDEPRYDIVVQAELEGLDETGAFTWKEPVETRNVSAGGAAILSPIAVVPGQFVLLHGTEKRESLLAIVRGCRQHERNRKYYLHLEFVTGKWPL